jgi:hypothetical protein
VIVWGKDGGKGEGFERVSRMNMVEGQKERGVHNWGNHDPSVAGALEKSRKWKVGKETDERIIQVVGAYLRAEQTL